MKKLLVTILVSLFVGGLFAQDNKVDRIPLSVIIEDIPEPFPETARVHLSNKINAVLAANGMLSVNYMNRFVLYVVATPLTKDIVPGPPMQIAQNLEYTMYILDNIEQKVFATYAFDSKGVGTNENKAYMDAIKRIRPNKAEMEAFVKQGRERIANYYNAEVENYIAKAKSLAQMKKYEEALFVLNCIPSVCDQYYTVLEVAAIIYQMYIDQKCVENLSLAKATWMSQQNSEGAAQTAQYLSQIYPDASCYEEAQKLYYEVKGKVMDDWNFEMKKYDDSVSIEKQKTDAWQAVGVAYGEGQEPITNTVNWLFR